MFFKKVGKEIAQGAKEEIIAPATEIDWKKVVNAGLTVLEFGVFIFAMFTGSKSNAETSTTVVVNNYIYKEEK